jgi:flavodoxin short chain
VKVILEGHYQNRVISNKYNPLTKFIILKAVKERYINYHTSFSLWSESLFIGPTYLHAGGAYMPKLAIVYLSTQGNTQMMAEAIAEGARERHVEVKVNNFHEWNPAEIADYDAIAVGSSTFYYTMLDPIAKFIDRIVEVGVDGKIGAAFGSYGWSGEAPVKIAEKLRNAGVEVIDPVLRIQYTPTEKDLFECNRLGKDLAERMKNR